VWTPVAWRWRATKGSVGFTCGRNTTNRAVSLLSAPSQEPTVEVPLTSLDHLLQEEAESKIGSSWNT
jgi:hypothetical protein